MKTPNGDSTNSLFSMNEESYLNLAMNRSVYYKEHDEMNELDKINEHIALHDGLVLNYKDISYKGDGKTVYKYIVILVGLPASGKSTIANQLIQKLHSNSTTSHIRCEIFNAGRLRREMSLTHTLKLANNSSEDLFSPKNKDKKEEIAKLTFQRLLNHIDNDLSDLAIFDAANSTLERRQLLFQQIHKYDTDPNSKFQLIPIVFQVSCMDSYMIRYNIHQKTFNEDYFDKPYKIALQDFAKRLLNYRNQFVPFTKTEFNTIHSHFFSNIDCFFFNLLNNGMDEDELLINFSSEKHPSIEVVIMVIQDFVINYGTTYGFPYIKKVRNFFKFHQSQQNTVNNTPPTRMNKNVQILTSIIDEPFLIKLCYNNSNNN